MQILEICEDYPPLTTGGIGNVVFTLAREWNRLGHSVHVLCGQYGGRLTTESRAGFAITRIPLPRFPPRNLWFQTRAVPLLQRYLSEADVVHAHSGSCGAIGSVSRGTKRPWVVTVHGLYNRTLPLNFSRPVRGRALRDDFVYTLGFPYLETLFRAEQCFAARLVFASRNMFQDACISYGNDLARKSCTIWVPASEEAFLQGARRPEQEFRFAYVGRLYWSKGVMLLVRAFSRLAKSNQGVVLRIYGAGPLEPSIRKATKRLGLVDLVELKGWTEHTKLLSEIAADVDVVVHPSLYEACPVAVLEAMSLGKPIIVSDLPWSHEFVADGVTGLRSRLDESSLSSQIGRLLKDEELRSRLGMNAQAFSRSNFHPEVIARKYLDLFDKLSSR